MTRLAFLSDIHGNLPALEAVISDLEQFHPDRVIVAGDLINSIPFDAEVIARVVSLGWSVVRGNHEFYMLNYGTERDRLGQRGSPSPAWLNKNLSDWYPYLASLPDELRLYFRDAPTIYVTHGLPHTPYDAISPLTPEAKVREWFAPIRETTIVTGHYHLSLDRQVDSWRIFNPGPVGAVMDGTHDACYLLLDAAGDHWEPTFRRVPYDFEQVEAAFQRHRLDEILGVEGFLKCEQIRRSRPTFNSFGSWMAEVHPGEDWTYERAFEFFALPLEAIWHRLGEGYHVNPDIPLPPVHLNHIPAR